MKLLIFIVIIIIIGCSKGAKIEKAEEKRREPPAKSSAKTLIDGMTGKTAIEAHKKAKATIEKVSDQKKRNLAEILE